MKRLNSIKKSILISFILMFVFAQILPAQQVKAAEKKGSITLKCGENAGFTFRLYLVAKQDGNDGYNLVEPFDEYSVDLTQTSAARTLRDYVERDNPEPLRMDETDGDGIIVFDALEEGAYLIIMDSFVYMNEDNKRVSVESNPIFLTVPENKEGVLNWDRDIDAKDVHDVISDVTPETVDVSVQKIWKDENNKNKKRPKSIVVQLMRDKEVVEEEELSEKNNWQHTWKDLEKATYRVVEKSKTDGYQVSNDNSGVNKFVLENTYKSDKPVNRDNTTSTGGSGGGSSSKLPQTGQLWWPIGIMLCAGLLCLIIGIRVGRKKEN